MVNKLDVPSLWTRQTGEVIAKVAELAADPGDARAAYEKEHDFWQQGGPGMAHTVDEHIPTPHGPVTVRRYHPVTSDAPQPVIVYFHGGGFTMGSADTHDRITRELAHRSGAPVVSVNYTLAPEARHPQQVEECVAVVEHLLEHGADWGLDGTDLTLAGDSAGAFLSLASFLHLRHWEAHRAIRCLLLFYGTFGLQDSVSWRTLGGPWDGLARDGMEVLLDSFLRDRSQLSDPSVDLLSNDLTVDVPPCHIVAAELDPLRDDSRCLADILRHAGIAHRYDEFQGVLHGFLHHVRMLDEASIALDNAATFFRQR